MIQFMVDSMLGPHGKMVSTFYLENQFVINSIIVGAGMIGLFKRRKKEEHAKTSESM
ncbi:hypothetical protein [Alkalicoccobacillus porphyridii]|uniref:hypothetical protein n=1 Tax=Alkalicoccobacillus porphyridii TaxID=2597270 RepID=UPI00163D9D39|nr:hypothetical protein [Alkalicoccobacillus porphyridii]